MDWEGEVRDNPDEPVPLHHTHGGSGDEDENKERCVICLMALRDRTIVGVCGHEFCVRASFSQKTYRLFRKLISP
jgi:E3 ubiquitin-protein ligase Topors